MRELSLGEFLVVLAEIPIATEHANHAALEKACRIVEKEAKGSLGEYQAEAGQFAGWAELADSTKAQRVALGFSENDPGLRSGEMRDSIGHVVETHAWEGGGEGVVGSNDPHMVFFELGTSKQPPRSVLGGALVRKTPEVVELLGRSAVGALIGVQVFGGSLPIIE